MRPLSQHWNQFTTGIFRFICGLNVLLLFFQEIHTDITPFSRSCEEYSLCVGFTLQIRSTHVKHYKRTRKGLLCVWSPNMIYSVHVAAKHHKRRYRVRGSFFGLCINILGVTEVRPVWIEDVKQSLLSVLTYLRHIDFLPLLVVHYLCKIETECACNGVSSVTAYRRQDLQVWWKV